MLCFLFDHLNFINIEYFSIEFNFFLNGSLFDGFNFNFKTIRSRMWKINLEKMIIKLACLVSILTYLRLR